ncbi:MAG: hypothetical protein RBT63_04930 [Bdellovibrionales bacterium]|jgi:opacity protein-like surface antigen|nr:hypothetical protein [Bdellovibrionales bacterium]
MKKLALILATVLCLTPALSQAKDSGFSLGLSALRFSNEHEGPGFGGSSEATVTLLNLKAGYTLASGLYVGGIYDMRTDESGGAKTDRSGYGVSVGFHRAGWFIDGSYFISSTIEAPGGIKFEDGSGFGVDLGRNFDISSNVYLGLQVSYRSFEYKKLAGVDQTNKWKSELTPMINIGLAF